MALDDIDAAGAAASGAPAIRKVSFEAPWRWLACGWRDLWRAPATGLAYGAAFSAASFIIVYGLYFTGYGALILPLAGGFLLVGPLLAVGLYETSRRLARGEQPGFREVATAGLRARGQLVFLGVLLLLIYILWMRLAFLLLLLFLGTESAIPVGEFLPALLFTRAGLGLLVVGTATGAVLAALVFAVSAISAPMLYDREMDVVTAAIASIRAVAENKSAMALWAVIIVALTAIGFVTQFVGLTLVFPLLGHATWHAYRDIVGEAG